MVDGQDQGAKVCVEVGGCVPEAEVGVAHFSAVRIEERYAGGWLKVVGLVPVGLRAPGEDCELVRREALALTPSTLNYPAFP
jgi:hypothetical protein